MYIDNVRHAIVNRSSSQISVYEKTVSSPAHTGGITAGGNRIGIIYPNEFYTLIPWPVDPPYTVNYITCYQIVFRDGNGAQRNGWIETSPGYTLGPYAWAAYQEPYHFYNSNGTGLVAASTESIDGSTYRIFTVKKAVTYRNPSGTSQGTLAVNTLLATNQSTTGQTYNGYMYFAKKKTGASWLNLVSGGTYGFVDLGLSLGSMPNDRAIW